MTQKRQDTKLEAEGAEFLVLGQLLIHGISAYKAYVNYPGYDLIAANPEIGRLCKVQVKSRWATDYDRSFPLKSLDSDFVVHVALNRGNRLRKQKTAGEGVVRPPEFYVLPTKLLMKYRGDDSWNKVRLDKIPRVGQYQDNWELIRKHLKIA